MSKVALPRCLTFSTGTRLGSPMFGATPFCSRHSGILALNTGADGLLIIRPLFQTRTVRARHIEGGPRCATGFTETGCFEALFKTGGAVWTGQVKVEPACLLERAHAEFARWNTAGGAKSLGSRIHRPLSLIALLAGVAPARTELVAVIWRAGVTAS